MSLTSIHLAFLLLFESTPAYYDREDPRSNHACWKTPTAPAAQRCVDALRSAIVFSPQDLLVPVHRFPGSWRPSATDCPLGRNPGGLAITSSLDILKEKNLTISSSGKQPRLRGMKVNCQDASFKCHLVTAQNLDGYNERIAH